MYYKPKKCLIPEAATTRKHLHFCDYCENLKNIYFQENLQTTASYCTNIFS